MSHQTRLFPIYHTFLIRERCPRIYKVDLIEQRYPPLHKVADTSINFDHNALWTDTFFMIPTWHFSQNLISTFLISDGVHKMVYIKLYGCMHIPCSLWYDQCFLRGHIKLQWIKCGDQVWQVEPSIDATSPPSHMIPYEDIYHDGLRYWLNFIAVLSHINHCYDYVSELYAYLRNLLVDCSYVYCTQIDDF